MCFYLMFSMNPGYALGSLGLMAIIYFIINRVNEDNSGLAKIFQGVIFQLSRTLQIFIQKAETKEQDWRPSVICIARHAFERTSDFDLSRWMCHRYGFGTYIHFIQGYLSKETHTQAEKDLLELIKIASEVQSNVYMDTMISPSYTTAIAQALQLPSISGKEGNMFLFEFSRQQPAELIEIINNVQLVKAANYDLCILSTSEKGFGFKLEIHIWVTQSDYENANLMILMSYIIMGHPDWKNANIKIYAIFPNHEAEQQRKMLINLAKEGRIPISPNNIRIITKKEDTNRKEIIQHTSKAADLVIIGFRIEAIRQLGEDNFMGFGGLANVLFVNAREEKEIK